MHRRNQPARTRAAVCLLACAAQAAVAAEDACRALDRDVAVEQTNAARARGARCPGDPAPRDAAPMRWSSTLEQAARAQASWLASQDKLLHTGAQGQTLSERARAVGYRFARVTENLGYGQAGLAQVLQGWTESPTHCANLFDPRVTEMALVCVPSAAGRPLWVMVQARPQ